MAGKSKTPTNEELGAQRQKEQEQRDAHFLRLARARLKAIIADETEPEGDAQDRRIAYIREAVPWAQNYMAAQDRETNAVVTYRLGVKLNNKATQESAENNLRDALQNKEIAAEELRRLLPKCHLGLIAGIAEWRGILYLPKSFRDLVGRDVPMELDADETGLRLDLGPANVATPAANGASAH